MSGTLRCYSFHSVKGGVGKSTLSVATALHEARRGAHVTLIDMDLTGTSLADVLGLEAPTWEGIDPTEALPLTRAPTGFLVHDETVRRMEQRDQFKRERMEEDPASPEARRACGVSFLNDYLLFTTPDWDSKQDMHLGALLWRKPGGPASLEVIPSSALPADLEQTIPVVFDENYSGFLEGRLEYLLDALVPPEGEERVVVLDTPPTVPGLSRAVLSLAFRLADRDPKVELSEDGGMPERLRNARVHWKAFLVGTLDRQDLRAMNRWVSLVQPDEERYLRCLVNRVPPGDALELRELLKQIIKEEELDRLMESAIVVDEDRSLQLFRSESTPEVPAARLKFLEEAEKSR